MMAMPYPGIDGDQPATWQPDHVSDGACVDGNDGDGIHSMLESSNVQDGSLRRLFDSEMFTLPMALHYLQRSEDNLFYLCNRIQRFPIHEVEFFLPQLLSLFIQNPTQYKAIRRLIINLSTEHLHVALLCIWLLTAELTNVELTDKKHFEIVQLLANIRGSKLKRSSEFRSKNPSLCSSPAVMKDESDSKVQFFAQDSSSGGESRTESPEPPTPTTASTTRAKEALDLHIVGGTISSPARTGHRRTKSDIVKSPHRLHSPVRRVSHVGAEGSELLSASPTGSVLYMGASSNSIQEAASSGLAGSHSSLDSGHAFDWPHYHPGATGHRRIASENVISDADFQFNAEGLSTVGACLKGQCTFVNTLTQIGFDLVKLASRDARRVQLQALLTKLNLNLPARVYVPIGVEPHQPNHHVVRIPPQESLVLNSKDRTPFMLQVEVVDCDNFQADVLPPKLSHGKLRHHRSFSDGGSTDLQALVQSPIVPSFTPDSQFFAEIQEYGNEDSISTDDTVNDSKSSFPWSLFRRSNRENPEMIDIPEESTNFSLPSENEEALTVADIRRRLSAASSTPDHQFQRGHADPSAIRAKEPWSEKVKRIRRMSPYGHLRSWRLLSVIVKSGADLRQELVATQLLSLFQRVWKNEKLSLWLRPIQIIVTSHDGGLIEVIGGAVSLHQTKKQAGDKLISYFIQQFGPINSEGFLTAQENFVESLAAYSIFTYLLQVKDRHNGNILIDNEGHLLHIDFGFFLSNSPGRNMNFETAPFKLLGDFIEVMGGVNADMFLYFRMLVFKGLLAARKYMEDFVTLLVITQQGSKLPCFTGGTAALEAFEQRFQRGLTDEQLVKHVDVLIQKSLNNARTRLYDNYQFYTNGIL